MSIDKKERILVVDDDIQIRRALRSALSVRGYEVSLAASGEEALDAAAADPPAMVILDLSLPGMGGLEVCRELRAWSNAPILILSVNDRESDIISALDAGADDYLTKPFKTGELLARIRAHTRRARQLPAGPAVLEAEGLRVNLSTHQVYLDEEELKLTKTEFALLQYLVLNAGRVVTYSLLLSNVWGPGYLNDTQTLRVHVGHLRKKIERDPNRPQFIITEPGIGYRFAAVPNPQSP
jgi:two-component system KDP operon response regulator KdpE